MASSQLGAVNGSAIFRLQDSLPSAFPRHTSASLQWHLSLASCRRACSVHATAYALQTASSTYSHLPLGALRTRGHVCRSATFEQSGMIDLERKRRAMAGGRLSSVRRDSKSGDSETLTDSETDDDASPQPPAPQQPAASKERAPPVPPQTLTLDDVNPVGLGRRSRQLFDDVWRRLTELGQLARSRPVDGADDYESVLIGGPMCDFTIPNAEYTTILIAGATGRVGRVLVRKLLLRGYKVKALVRSAEDPVAMEVLPPSVQVVVGDLTDYSTLKTAVEGCQKVVFCASSRSRDSLDELQQVDSTGVSNLIRAFQDSQHGLARKRAGRSSRSKLALAKNFEREDGLDGWELREGQLPRFGDPANAGGEGALKFDTDKDAQVEALDNGCAVFSGYVYARGDYVELAKTLKLPDGVTLDRFEGLVLRVRGDGKSYSLVLETQPREGVKGQLGAMYTARFTARPGYSRIRIPFSVFLPTNPTDPPLNLTAVRKMAIRYEARRQKAPAVARPAPRPGSNGVVRGETAAADPLAQNSFRLEIDYIKALPGGEETDFILLSCTGAGAEPEQRENVIRAKQAGEMALRNSGLGYTIIRPGPLQEEPGGQKALVFDQGNRITQGISCADVADVCVKALHDPTARNKSFDVCYEYSSEEGQGLYELVAHLPDKSNNYLTPALALLEKNT